MIKKFNFKMDAFFGIIGSIATINEKIIFGKISGLFGSFGGI